ncbi:Uma2 family endonuclease [Desulfosporosinus sp. PR]|uniref:Uma2 family endonuclease n=1 Tax=Candidatus Desulfosporosinus nitrosoreducens TaxID=3401928 RepID=UPI0027EBB8C3|nr:Uma2 family endonuclease [Desulfosporosinus sp. PR]MDQ7092856.1 Uma2 family endonuclease [Desulfosporosinus sp. PR]
MSESAHHSEQLFTYQDYLTWPENERWELLNGRPYNMTPAPSRRHQEISGQLLTLFNNYLKGKTCRVYAAPFDVRLPQPPESAEQASTVVQPDLVIVCDKTKLDQRGCQGSPDLVVEITSPSTFQKDLKDKFLLYEKVGVQEYWIVYPEENTLCVFNLTTEGKYSRPEVYTERDSVKVGLFNDLTIELPEVFA